MRGHVNDWVHTFSRINLNSTLSGWEVVPELSNAVDRIIVSESTCPQQSLPLDALTLQVHVYQPSDTETFEEFSNNTSAGDEDDTMAASVCELPNIGWEGLWDSLIYADDIKMKLLDYIHATLIFSDASVNCGCPLSTSVNEGLTIWQSILSLGIASYCCMDHPEQERHPCAELWPKNFRFAYLIGAIIIINSGGDVLTS